MDFNRMSKDEIIQWMSVNLSTKELEDCLKNTSETVSKTPTLTKSSKAKAKSTPLKKKSKVVKKIKSLPTKLKPGSKKIKFTPIKKKRTSSGGHEETKNTSTPPSSSKSRLDNAKKAAIDMCKNMKHITINSVVYKGKKKTAAQIRYNVSKELLKKSMKGGKGDKVSMTLTLAALKKECKSNKFGNKKQIEKYLLRLMRPN